MRLRSKPAVPFLLLFAAFTAFMLVLPAYAHAYAQMTVTVMTHGSAHLSWSPGATQPRSRITNWDIYRASASAGPFSFIASLPASTTSYTDTTVAAGRKYFYRVTAINTVGMESRPSSTVTAVVPPGVRRKVTGTPISLWPENQQPGGASSKDTGAVELGLRFTSDVPGYVAGMRFYKGLANKGPHTGTLWSSAGAALATGTFVDDKPSGWQTLRFTDAVFIQPRTTYVLSYHTTVGQYAYDENYFTASHDRPPLHAPRDAGVFRYGASGFPNKSYKATNYWIDVIFLPGN